MSAALLICTAATLFMTGVVTFVQIVHYPLFGSVGEEGFVAYHEDHSRLTTRVVFVPMLAELLTAWVLVLDPPAGETSLAVAGALLATATWALTAFVAVPSHRALGAGADPNVLSRLIRANLIRTLVWAAHSAVCLALVALAA